MAGEIGIYLRQPKKGEIDETATASGRRNDRYRSGDNALVLNTMPTYITVIGIADERWKISAARNSRHHLLPLTTDVLALVNR